MEHFESLLSAFYEVFFGTMTCLNKFAVFNISSSYVIMIKEKNIFYLAKIKSKMNGWLMSYYLIRMNYGGFYISTVFHTLPYAFSGVTKPIDQKNRVYMVCLKI